MPIFEYQCPEGHTIEAYVPQGMSDMPAAKTAVCYKCSGEGKTNLAEKVLSATPTTFKQNDRKAIKGR